MPSNANGRISPHKVLYFKPARPPETVHRAAQQSIMAPADRACRTFLNIVPG